MGSGAFGLVWPTAITYPAISLMYAWTPAPPLHTNSITFALAWVTSNIALYNYSLHLSPLLTPTNSLL